MPWTIRVALACLLLSAGASAQTFTLPENQAWMQVQVTTEKPVVIDGDTVRFGGVTHRLVGYDAPEIYSPKCSSEREKGYQASGRLSQLINARRVRLEPTGKRDKYRRQLARLYVGDEDVAAVLIREGLARPYSGRDKRQSWCE